jgi:hypothetical protein
MSCFEMSPTHENPSPEWQGHHGVANCPTT